MPNHTSDRHAWFQAALAAGPGSAARDRYIFRQGKGADGELPPNDWESVFGGPGRGPGCPTASGTCTCSPPSSPTSTGSTPRCTTEFASVLRFWLDLGVDGFRIDVAHGMVKAAGLPDIGHAEPGPDARHRGACRSSTRTACTRSTGPGARSSTPTRASGSASPRRGRPPRERLARYVRPDELHQAFNFQFLTAPWDAAEFRAVIDESLARSAWSARPRTWVLSNHDVDAAPSPATAAASSACAARARRPC